MGLEKWDMCLPTVVFAVNNRVVRVHGFTPAHRLLYIYLHRKISKNTYSNFSKVLFHSTKFTLRGLFFPSAIYSTRNNYNRFSPLIQKIFGPTVI